MTARTNRGSRLLECEMERITDLNSDISWAELSGMDQVEQSDEKARALADHLHNVKVAMRQIGMRLLTSC